MDGRGYLNEGEVCFLFNPLINLYTKHEGLLIMVKALKGSGSEKENMKDKKARTWTKRLKEINRSTSHAKQ